MTGIVTLPTARTLVLAPVPPATPATPVTLPLSGWHVSRLEQPDGRSLLEVADADGDLVGLAGSTIRPALSVDAAWRGVGYDANGNRRWWALAIGHAGANGAQPVVTFTRHVDANRHPRRAVVRHSTWHGLWLAAAAGPYTSISCTHDGAYRIRRLALAPTFNHGAEPLAVVRIGGCASAGQARSR